VTNRDRRDDVADQWVHVGENIGELIRKAQTDKRRLVMKKAFDTDRR
jgi:hypothetical protein